MRKIAALGAIHGVAARAIGTRDWRQGKPWQDISRAAPVGSRPAGPRRADRAVALARRPARRSRVAWNVVDHRRTVARDRRRRPVQSATLGGGLRDCLRTWLIESPFMLRLRGPRRPRYWHLILRRNSRAAGGDRGLCGRIASCSDDELAQHAGDGSAGPSSHENLAAAIGFAFGHGRPDVAQKVPRTSSCQPNPAPSARWRTISQAPRRDQEAYAFTAPVPRTPAARQTSCARCGRRRAIRPAAS